MNRLSFLMSASALALVWGGAAAAQPAPAAATSSTDAQPAPAAPGGSADTTTQDNPADIIVTAQRRSERLQTSPTSMSVLTGTDLAHRNIVNVDQLQFAMPNVAVDNFGQGLEFNIRGIGKGEHNSQTTTGVVTYRDGVATFPGYFLEEPYFDIASVEVLRGPQGTIAGENATGGAVFVNTNNPMINGGNHGYIQGQFGNYTDVGLQGALNLPISDTFAARIAFYGERRNGFYHVTGPGGAPYNGSNGDLREGAGRISFLWRPSSRLTVVSKTDFDYLHFGGYPATPYANYYRFFPIGSTTPNPNYQDLYDTTANSPQHARDKFIRESFRIDYDFGAATLRSITGYQTGNITYTADLDGTSAGNATFFDNVSERIFSQELNLISRDNQRFTYLLGAFAQWGQYDFLPPYQFVIGTPPGTVAGEYKLQGINPTRSLAAFGQFGFMLTHGLKLEVGGRYTESRSRNDVQIIQNGLPLVDQQSEQWHSFSYKVSLGWEVDPHNYLYAFRATGFKPGGLNVPVGLGIPAPFDSETITDYELGWRGNYMGGRVHLTIDGYYNDYRNFQVIVGYPAFPVFGFELNVPNSTIVYGAEAEAGFHLGRFTLDLGVALNHSKLGGFFATDSRIPALAACDPFTGPASASCINLRGREQTYAPNFTFNASAQYDFDLGGGATLTPRVNFGSVGRQWATLFENSALGDRIAQRNILGAQLALTYHGWTLTAYGTNLTNQHYVSALNSGLYFAGAPRQYGVRLLRLF